MNTLFCSCLSNDETWSFGFAYNIAQGMIPYRDFNMVVTPLFSLLFGFHLQILGTSILSFHILEAILVTAIMYLCFPLFGKKSWFLLLICFFPLNLLSVIPTYNFLLFFLVILIIYLERKQSSNQLLIGALLALTILTKQTTGCFIAFTGLFLVRKDKQTLQKRLFGFILPLLCFLCYLLLTNAFIPFWDQCFFGLFDFATSNNNKVTSAILFAILLWILLLYKIQKKPKDSASYYILAFTTIILPLFDFLHIMLAYIAIVFLCLLDSKPFPKWSYYLIGILYIFLIFAPVHTLLQSKGAYPNQFDPLAYRYIPDNVQEGFQLLTKIHLKYKDYDSYLLSSDGYNYKLINQLPITRLDLINRGNQGYHGTEKTITYLKNTKEGSIFIILRRDLTKLDYIQTDKEVLKYVIEHFEKVESIGPCDIYRHQKEALN